MLQRPWPRLAVLLAIGAALLISFEVWRGSTTLDSADPGSGTAVAAAAAPSKPLAVQAAATPTTSTPAREVGTIEARVAPKLRYAGVSPELPTEPVAEWVADFRARAAQGDADAAYVLSHALQRCAPLGARDATNRDTLEATALRLARDETERANIAEAQATARREQLAYCAGLTPPSRNEAYDMLELAAQLGSVEAASAYLNRPPQYILEVAQGAPITLAQAGRVMRLSHQQFEVAREAQARGSAEAIRWLAWRANAGGTEDGTWDIAKRDLVAAYAGFLAYRMIRFAAQRGSDRATEDNIAKLERELRPEQMDEATARAFALASDPECCLVQP